MKRQSFLQMAGMGLVALPAFATAAGNKNKKIKVPPYLKPGDTIGITCPAGFSLLETIQPSIDLIQSWGYKIKLGNTIGKMDHTFGGTDAERAEDFQQMMDDPNIKAILCATGGYGAVRMVDFLDFKKMKQSPKWVVGFSDITVLHSHLHQVVHMASLHSKMCGSFPKDWATADAIQQASILSIKDALEGKKITYPSIPVEHNRIGTAKGILVGGNLKILENLNGSASMMNTDAKILFVEDVGEPLYNIDRMFCNLLRSGKLSN
jgi:muramoyltetrapeptide carboxypeptidase